VLAEGGAHLTGRISQRKPTGYTNLSSLGSCRYVPRRSGAADFAAGGLERASQVALRGS
jgi:hypothetical protein